MKKLLAILLSVLLLTVCVPMGAISVAAESTSGITGDCTWTLDGTHLTISGEGEMENYENYEGYEYPAPWGTGITAVTIEEGVTTVADDAFYHCTKLTSITIPDSVTKIGYDAFNGCTALASVTLGRGVTVIRSSAFAYCTSLTSVNIPEKVETIESDAFTGCVNFTAFNVAIENPYFSSADGLLLNKCGTAVERCPSGKAGDYVIPNGITYIGNNAFEDCALLTSVTIPDGVTDVSWEAFRDCTTLTSVTIPDSVTELGQYAFAGCSSLAEAAIPTGVTEIQWGVFHSCTSLISVTLPNSITSIGDSAFMYCSSLASIIIPESVTEIEASAFDYCTSLATVTIPRNMIKMEYNIFDFCSSLMTIEVAADHPLYCSVDGVLFSKDKTTLVDYPDGRTGHYTIPDHVTSIKSHAFYACSLSSLTIPNSVNAKYLALCNSYNLTSMIIPNGNTYICDCMFYDCSSLTSVIIPASVSFIDYDAFYGCSSLTDVYYAGSEEDRAKMNITEWGNAPLLDATWHYNYVPEPAVTPGDANGDGSVNNRDLGMLQQYLNGWGTGVDTAALDLNNDGKVNNRDLGLLQQHLNSWGVELG